MVFASCSAADEDIRTETAVPVAVVLAIVEHETQKWEEYLSDPPVGVVVMVSDRTRVSQVGMPTAWEERFEREGLIVGGLDRLPGRSELGVVFLGGYRLGDGSFEAAAEVFHHFWDDIGDFWEYLYDVSCGETGCEVIDRTLMIRGEISWPREDG